MLILSLWRVNWPAEGVSSIARHRADNKLFNPFFLFFINFFCCVWKCVKTLRTPRIMSVALTNGTHGALVRHFKLWSDNCPLDHTLIHAALQQLSYKYRPLVTTAGKRVICLWSSVSRFQVTMSVMPVRGEGQKAMACVPAWLTETWERKSWLQPSIDRR